MDRASDSGSEGWGFESLPVYQRRIIRTTSAGSDYFYVLKDENKKNAARVSAAREGLTERILSVSSPFRCTKKADTHMGICFFAAWKETRRFKSNSPVGCWASPVLTAMHPYHVPKEHGQRALSDVQKQPVSVRRPATRLPWEHIASS